MGCRVSIVLITFNSARYLPACLAAVGTQSGVDADLVVIDNESSDASLELVRDLAPKARIVANAKNRGYCAAANQGIALSEGEFVLLLNPDVRLSPDYLDRITSAMSAAGNRYGSGTGKLLRGAGDSIAPTTVVDSLGITMTRNGRHLDIRAGHQDTGSERQREVFGVSGAAAVHRRVFLDDVSIGGEVLDESFFAYREDADLAWRGRLFGWKALLVPEAVAWHVRTVTPERRGELSPEINMHSVKNRFLLRLKNEGRDLAAHNFPFELGRDVLVLGAALTVERTSLPALRWLWHHREEVLQKRREIQRRRRVSDREIARWFGGEA